MSTTTTTDLVDDYIETKARLAEIEGELRALTPGTHEAGEHTITVTPNRRFDRAGFEKRYPADTNPELYVEETRHVLDPNQVDEVTRDAFTREFAPKITIK